MTNSGAGSPLTGYGPRRGTVAFSWGPWGGFYFVHGLAVWRVCVGWFALTWIPRLEIDTLMRAYADSEEIVAW